MIDELAAARAKRAQKELLEAIGRLHDHHGADALAVVLGRKALMQRRLELELSYARMQRDFALLALLLLMAAVLFEAFKS